MTMIVLTMLMFRASVSLSQNNLKLTDGQYEIKLKADCIKTIGFTLFLKGNHYKATEPDGKWTNGEIEWVTDSLFRLHVDKVLEKGVESRGSLHLTLLTLGDPCFALSRYGKLRLTFCTSSTMTLCDGQIARKTDK